MSLQVAAVTQMYRIIDKKIALDCMARKKSWFGFSLVIQMSPSMHCIDIVCYNIVGSNISSRWFSDLYFIYKTIFLPRLIMSWNVRQDNKAIITKNAGVSTTKDVDGDNFFFHRNWNPMVIEIHYVTTQAMVSLHNFAHAMSSRNVVHGPLQWSFYSKYDWG